MLFYRHEGALCPITEVTVLADGSTLVTRDKGKGVEEAKFQLSQSELSALGVLVDAVGFFSSAEDPWSAKGVGKSILRVSLAGRSRELHYGLLRGIEPLTSFAWSLITQATTVADLKESGDVYQARSASSPNCAGPKVLQPHVLREPLEAFLRTTADYNKLSVGLEALT